jgi:peptidoglycan/LPS O-acetylase OafA/YrhL
MIEKHSRPLLDRLRWVAALAVVLGHAIGLFISLPTKSASMSTEKIAWYIADMRHPAVLVFFVLSGYLVGGSVLCAGRTFSLRRYVIARFSRIYIVLIPALVLTITLDATSFLIDPSNEVYATVWPSGVIGSIALYDRYSVANLIATVFLVQEFTGSAIGSATPLWSLSYEWIFYFVFPFAVGCARRAGSLWLTIPMVVAIAALPGLVHKLPIGWMFVLWCTGAAARYVQEHIVIPRGVALIGAVMCVGGILGIWILPQRVEQLLVTAGLATYLSRFVQSENSAATALDSSLAGFSYSLYIIHVPILVFCAFVFNRMAWLPKIGLPVGTEAIELIVACLLLVLPLSYLFSRMFEVRTDRMRKWLSGGQQIISPPPRADVDAPAESDVGSKATASSNT